MPRLLRPEVWDEDGTQNLTGFWANGLSDLLEPVNGYLITVSKLITHLSALISVALYPIVSTVFAWLFTLFVFVTIARSPLYLKGGLLLAVTSLLIPSNPEVFGLPLYTFWWSALLLLIAVFWREDSPHPWFRTAIIALGSVSSPVCLVTLPLFWVRAWLFRVRPIEAQLAVAASAFAAIQFWAMWPIGEGGHLDLAALPQVVPVFLGSYAVGNILPGLTWLMGGITGVYLLVGLGWGRSPVVWGLAYLWGVSVLMSITRVDIEIIHPERAGPRYFFLPYVVLGWMLLQFALAGKRRWFRMGGWLLLILSLVNAFPVLTRHHDRLNWPGHVASCSHFSEYRIPVHFDGNALLAWNFPIAGAECEKIVTRDLLGRFASETTYPYRVVGKATEVDLDGAGILGTSAVVGGEWRGTDYPSAATGVSELPDNLGIIGSYLASDADAGSLTVRMRRGERILYRFDPGSHLQTISVVGTARQFFSDPPPIADWVVLEFSSMLLPDEFEVRFEDGGDGIGEWSAVALLLGR